MMENMVENHGNGYTFMLERVNNYIERILAAKPENLQGYELHGTLTDPVTFETLPGDLQTLLGARTAEQAKLFGKRTAELHLALASGSEPEFKPDPFSLHYQRSLFSSMQTLVRETFQNKQQHLQRMPENVRKEAEILLSMKEEVLNSFRRIYAKKLDMLKIRIHGNFNLSQILLMGKDVAIHDFLGNTVSSFSERRLKRSAFRDVAGIIRSFHNVAYQGFFQNHLVQQSDRERLIPFAILWAHYVTGFFMKAYLDEVKESTIVPHDQDDLRTVLQFYLLRKAMYDLNYELKRRPEWAIVPLRLIKSIIKPRKESLRIESFEPAERVI
jgi:maltose alpha-D-glucosyltransferase/alpha-amylase